MKRMLPFVNQTQSLTHLLFFELGHHPPLQAVHLFLVTKLLPPITNKARVFYMNRFDECPVTNRCHDRAVQLVNARRVPTYRVR